MPKYLADAFDGKVPVAPYQEEETRAKFQYGEEPPHRAIRKRLWFIQNFVWPNRTLDADKVSVTPERTIGIPTKPADSNEDYKNVRDLK